MSFFFTYQILLIKSLKSEALAEAIPISQVFAAFSVHSVANKFNKLSQEPAFVCFSFFFFFKESDNILE